MNWQRFMKSPRRPTDHRLRYRPTLDLLEDRTLLTLTTFTLYPYSAASLNGSYFTYAGTNYPINEQSPGSLSTTYTGTIATDLDLTANTINFLNAGTALNASISGNWQPGVGGTPGQMDPANYGGVFQFLGTNYTAIRDLVVGLPTTGPVPLTAQGGGFYTYPSNQNIQINAGNLDYDTALFGHGRTSITGLAGQNQAADGLLQDNGDGTFTLYVPIQASIVYDLGGGASATIQVTGSASGTGTPGTGPHVGFFQLSGSHAGGSGQQTAPLANPLGSSSMGMPSAAPMADTQVSSSPVQDGGLGGAIAQAARQGNPVGHDQFAALDAVFQDPMANAGVPF